MATITIAGRSSTLLYKVVAVTANTTVDIPAGYAIRSLYVVNTTGNAVTGGIKIGTTDGGIDVIVALAVGANLLLGVLDATLLKRLFSLTVAQTLYIQTVTLWNSASLIITFDLIQVV